jgi:hypothetical protein
MDATVMEQLQTWRAEIGAELTEARQAAADAAADLRTTTVARDVAHARTAAFRFALSGLRQPLPSALARRIEPLDRDVHSADGAVARATAMEANARVGVADLEDALSQLMRLLAPPPPVEESADDMVDEVTQ